MNKNGIILMLAILMPLTAFAGKKKQQDDQDTTALLDAATPDGSPTLRQTRDWLKAALEGYGGYYNGGSARPIESVQIDGKCNFTYKERYIYKLDKQNVIVASYEMQVGAIKHVSVEGDRGDDVVLRLSTGQASAIRVTDEEGKATYTNLAEVFLGRVPEARSSQDQVPQTPAQMAPRVIKALVHAADLCRSTYHEPSQSEAPF